MQTTKEITLDLLLEEPIIAGIRTNKIFMMTTLETFTRKLQAVRTLKKLKDNGNKLGRKGSKVIKATKIIAKNSRKIRNRVISRRIIREPQIRNPTTNLTSEIGVSMRGVNKNNITSTSVRLKKNKGGRDIVKNGGTQKDSISSNTKTCMRDGRSRGWITRSSNKTYKEYVPGENSPFHPKNRRMMMNFIGRYKNFYKIVNMRKGKLDNLFMSAKRNFKYKPNKETINRGTLAWRDVSKMFPFKGAILLLLGMNMFYRSLVMFKVK